VADFLLNLLGIISVIFLSYRGGELVGKLKLPNVLEMGLPEGRRNEYGRFNENAIARGIKQRPLLRS